MEEIRNLPDELRDRLGPANGHLALRVVEDALPENQGHAMALVLYGPGFRCYADTFGEEAGEVRRLIATWQKGKFHRYQLRGTSLALLLTGVDQPSAASVETALEIAAATGCQDSSPVVVGCALSHPELASPWELYHDALSTALVALKQF